MRLLVDFPGYRVCPFLIMVVAAVLAGCTDSASTTKSTEEDIKLISEISAARAKAFNDGNAAGIAVHFADSCVLMAPGKPASFGTQAVQAYYQSIFDEFHTELESHYEDVEVSGSLAYGRGEAKVTITPKNGGPSSTSTSKYLNILEKQADGTWKTTHDIWNGNEGE